MAALAQSTEEDDDRQTDRLMVVPEPSDKAFVERVKLEVADARKRCLESAGLVSPT
jgi:hypothetical protein